MSKKSPPNKSKMILGWREWAGLPEIAIPAVKIKIDTGAKTSALHAFDIKKVIIDGKKYIKFKVHPIQKNTKITVTCTAPLIDKRNVRSSAGHEQNRYVIKTPVKIGKKTWEIEISLTRRDSMGYRMLLGREAMNMRAIVDPGKSFCQGKRSTSQIKKLYQ